MIHLGTLSDTGGHRTDGGARRYGSISENRVHCVWGCWGCLGSTGGCLACALCHRPTLLRAALRRSELHSAGYSGLRKDQMGVANADK